MSTQVSNEKPSLNGVKIHARKRDAKAQAKYEPEEFRSSIFQVISDIPKTDFGKISTALDTAGNTLDYRRYGDTFFEVLTTGGIIAPGGIIKDDESLGKLPFSLFVLARKGTYDEQLAGAKIWTNLITKLTRRYKYLERTFAETSVHVLENIHRYGDEDNRMLAIGLGVLVSEGFMPMDCFRILQKDHLTKDGVALGFMTDVLRVYLRDNNGQQLSKALKSAKIRQLADFFPVAKRDNDCFVRHFEAQDLPQIIELHTAQQTVAMRDALVVEMARIVRDAQRAAEDETDGDDEVFEAANVKLAKAVQKTMRRNSWNEHDVVVLVWDALMASVDWPLRPDQVEALAVQQIQRFSMVLEAFTQSPKSEIALLKHVQMHCYSEPKLLKAFGRMVYELYEVDVLSDSAILFWAAKGVRFEGKTEFLKQTESFVKKLQALEDADDSDEEESEDDEE
ncbi:hypothetical protein H4R99_004773 [Coemansia sp. RSA 1722]|nr:hypothetical protein LPJ57_003040 [Coemansia sp. RSA 486]KAJ2234286.1 hypothetical protein IWW45_003521 [Coemansia sp. RSA 485]KAJ2596800.1 hypothetical protein H4R99_004773 [Coemansia sp. RSA 1722]KAJ2636859.1 hypothetical protein GGF40_002748 [Coemansia sp. RSA 1286]